TRSDRDWSSDVCSSDLARQRPGGFSKQGRWRESLPVPEHWQRFGRRSSMLTAKPWRATDPANACLNLAYALLRCETTIALMAQRSEERRVGKECRSRVA